MRRSVLLGCFALCACSTEVSRLQLEKSQYLRIEQGAARTAGLAENEHYDPARYDLYLKISPSVFDQLLASFDNTRIAIEQNGRPITIELQSVRLAFVPGYPQVLVKAAAIDDRTNIRADLELDASLLMEGDPAVPDKILLRLVATRIVPKISWGPFDFTRWRFARDILSLEATRLANKIAPVEIPLQKDFAVGGPAGTRVISVPVKDGAINGNLRTPATELHGALAVKQVLFLRNGIHIFANVEGL